MIKNNKLQAATSLEVTGFFKLGHFEERLVDIANVKIYKYIEKCKQFLTHFCTTPTL